MADQLAQYTETALAEVSPLMARSQAILAAAGKQTVGNDNELRSATAIKKDANAHSKAVKDLRLQLTRPVDDFKDKMIAKEREILAPVEEAKRVLERNILAYDELLEQRRLAEEARVAALIDRVNALYRAGMTKTQVEAGRKDAKALITELGSDANLPRVKLALVDLSQQFTGRMQDIEIEEQRANKKKLDQKQAEIDAEARRQAVEVARQAAAVAQQEADREAARAERDRPKSGIREKTTIEITDENEVDRLLCSPDLSKIRQYATAKELPAGDYPGFRVIKNKGVQ